MSFKAGLAHLIDGVLTPDPRRGLLRVIVVESEALLRVQWGQRSEGLAPLQPDIDFVILPEEAELVYSRALKSARVQHSKLLLIVFLMWQFFAGYTVARTSAAAQVQGTFATGPFLLVMSDSRGPIISPTPGRSIT